jgi:hypothetical protein
VNSRLNSFFKINFPLGRILFGFCFFEEFRVVSIVGYPEVPEFENKNKQHQQTNQQPKKKEASSKTTSRIATERKASLTPELSRSVSRQQRPRPTSLKDEERSLVRHLSHRISFHAAVPKFHIAVNQKRKFTLADYLAVIVESSWFHAFIVLIVLLDFCFFFLEADEQVYHDIGKTAVLTVEVVVAAIFVIEATIKIYVYGFFGIFLNTWNLVDL